MRATAEPGVSYAVSTQEKSKIGHKTKIQLSIDKTQNNTDSFTLNLNNGKKLGFAIYGNPEKSGLPSKP